MKHFAKIATVLLLTTFIFVQPASANTSVTTHTKMTVSKSKVHKGDVVKFKVTLKAGKKKCRVHMPIELFRNKKLLKTKNTNDQGKVVFKKHIQKTHTWKAKFPGKKVGQHPKRLNCLASQSKAKKITVIH